MKTIFIILELWTLLSIIGLILIYFRNDARLVIEDWKKVEEREKPIFIFLTVLLVYFILPFSIPYSISHFKRK
jgi:hypothetical protein